jgi:hypothetical protein
MFLNAYTFFYFISFLLKTAFILAAVACATDSAISIGPVAPPHK